MGTGADQAGHGARLIELRVGDEPEAWSRAGFTVSDGVVHAGQVRIRLLGSGPDGARGIVSWEVAGLEGAEGQLDGLPTSASYAVVDDAAPAPPHPNGTIGLDHVVVLTPDLDRTIAACEAAGLELRRIRDTTGNGSPMRQAFFKLGPVVLEVVSGDVGVGLPAADAPATFWGLAVDVDDLDATAAAMGDGLGRIKTAVQRGRRIATVRTKDHGISVAIAAMDRRGDRTPSDDGR
ncbi:MAG TPA: VOC family protein [Acidimicrobiales bacterium]|nr:VOC family protein [Acidimicrobiales bacterium]